VSEIPEKWYHIKMCFYCGTERFNDWEHDVYGQRDIQYGYNAVIQSSETKLVKGHAYQENTDFLTANVVSSSTYVAAPENEIIASITGTRKLNEYNTEVSSWGKVSYKFWDNLFYNFSEGWKTSDAFSNSDKVNLENLFSTISDVCGIEFEESAGFANINILSDDFYSGAYGMAQFPGTGSINPSKTAGFLQYSTTLLREYGTGNATINDEVFLHEVLHSLGIGHPHDIGGGSTVMLGVVDLYSDGGDLDLNNSINTVMTYRNANDHPELGSLINYENMGRSQTPMALDVAALQHLYGVNLQTRTGDDTYYIPWLTGSLSQGWSCIWDAGGTDTLSAENGNSAVIDLRAASLVGEFAGGRLSWQEGNYGGFTIANGAIIENAVGSSGDDVIYGNAYNNIVTSGYGNDELYAFGGTNTLNAGAGDDKIYLCNDLR
jgi:Ca2+-binding RTX toxin-like protein